MFKNRKRIKGAGLDDVTFCKRWYTVFRGMSKLARDRRRRVFGWLLGVARRLPIAHFADTSRQALCVRRKNSHKQQSHR
jgi:hypothetical protein